MCVRSQAIRRRDKGIIMTIGVVGLGLIGGSMAKAIKLYTEHTVLGYDISETEVCKAELMEAIDERLDVQNLPSCNMVIVALYPSDIIKYIQENADIFSEGTIVVDCGGVKAAICEGLKNTVRGRTWHFIGGHPMAGREYSGFRYAKDDLFENASMILTPDSSVPLEIISEVKRFFLTLGFSRIMLTTPERHDEMIAYTSQMAHIVSNAYVRSELALKHSGFSANSFKDMTRVARLNESMWTELFLLNREALISELDGIIERLQTCRDAISGSNEEKLKTTLREGSERKMILDE